MKKISVKFVMLLGFIALAACGGASDEAIVTGTVTYLQRIALPENSVVSVQIQDTSIADAAAEVMGEQIIETSGQQVPIPFEVPYNPDDIQENHMYSIRATIRDAEGTLLFTTDTVNPVITNGAPTENIELVLIQVGG